MYRPRRGFTLVELMIVVLIVGILAAIAIPNFIAMQNRAKEGSTKANMHTFQLSAEDYAVQNNGFYATDAGSVVPLLPGGDAFLLNPFSHLVGSGAAWEDRQSFAASASSISGITSYADSAGAIYNLKGYGRSAAIPLVLSSGQ